MKYVVAKIGGSQFRLRGGEKVEVDRISRKEGDTLEFSEILLAVNGEKMKVGTPFLKEVKVKAKILKHFLGDKILVSKFKAKTGYRRRTGFRPQKTLLSIGEITA